MLTAAIIAMLLPVAQAPWGASRCTGHEQITVLSPAEMVAQFGPNTDGAVAAIADPTCRVWIKSDLNRRAACTVLTHELGHLAGLDHSTNPRSVMFPMPSIPKRCKKLR